MTMVGLTGDLYFKDVLVGTGAVAEKGALVDITYSGYLKDGTQFGTGDTGLTRLVEGPGGFITGWVLGVPGMRVGGKRKLVVGSSYAYGAPGNGPIPPHATLVFDIELKAVK